MDAPRDLNTPPVEQPELVEKPPAWPKVIGVLCVIYAILGIIGNVCNGSSPFYQGAILSVMGIKDVQMPTSLVIFSVVGSLLGLILGILLLVGAYGLLMRKKSGYKLVLTWVVLRIVFAIIGLGLGFATVGDNVLYQKQIQESTSDMMESRGVSTSSMPQKTDVEIASSAKMTLLIATTVVVIFPIVVGLLLSSRTRREYVLTWGMEAA